MPSRHGNDRCECLKHGLWPDAAVVGRQKRARVGVKMLYTVFLTRNQGGCPIPANQGPGEILVRCPTGGPTYGNQVEVAPSVIGRGSNFDRLIGPPRPYFGPTTTPGSDSGSLHPLILALIRTQRWCSVGNTV